jgi:hypothetical protein
MVNDSISQNPAAVKAACLIDELNRRRAAIQSNENSPDGYRKVIEAYAKTLNTLSGEIDRYHSMNREEHDGKPSLPPLIA